MARLQEDYKEKILPALMEQFGYTSVMQVPKITKITLNMGLGEAVADKKVVQSAVSDMEKISGHKYITSRLPTGFCQAWNISAHRGLSKHISAQAKFAIKTMWTTCYVTSITYS
jgi:ribosomal protein L5